MTFAEIDPVSRIKKSVGIIIILLMLAETNEKKPTIRQFLSQQGDNFRQRYQQKIPALPLEFEYYPVQILSKEFTKLGSSHPYRIHYLGPRPLNTLILHKRFSRNEQCEEKSKEAASLMGIIQFKHYKMNLKKIINCNYTNQRLQQNNHYRSAIFYRAFEGMNPTLPLQNQLIFNSAFQSGNLDCVIKAKPNQYDLFLRIDSNTRGHTSWYYFSIKNGSNMDTVTLNICNLTKPNNLYQQGLRPFIFSKKNWLENQVSWAQAGENCKFQQAKLRYELIYEQTSIHATYKLSFDYTFKFEQDQVFFAYCIPYTYSQLQQNVERYKESSFVKTEILGKSLTGVDMPILHISNHEYQEKKKKNIVMTARVHPGQTNSSHMLNGFIHFLLDNSKEAEELRNNTNFFIVPMLNPDGVILGNSRTSASGKDLNRQFLSQKRQLYPQVFHIKTFTAKIQRKYGVFTYIDFHGHSRRKNTFLYGPNYPMSCSDYYKCRILPKLIQKVDPKFRFYSCSFMISQQKKATARAVMLNQLKVQYSYTIQSSIGLFYNPLIMKTEPFNQENWKQMGQSIGIGLCNFILTFIEHQSIIKERKTQRWRHKQLKDQRQQRTTNSKLSNKFKEDEFQLFSKSKKGSAFMELLQEVKIASDQLKNFDEEVESDDQDQRQDLEGYKLIQFNNLVTKSIQRQKISSKNKNQEQIDFEALQFPSHEQQEEDDLVELKPPHQSLSPKKAFLTIKYPRTEDNFKKEKLSTQLVSSSKLLEAQSKKLIISEQAKKNNEEKDKSYKNFVLKNKERYSIATKNLFPIEDKCEILALPKNIQVMRKSMKKGRLLINNLEESRLKFFSVGLKPDLRNEVLVRRQNKIPFLQMQKYKNITKSSTGVIKLTTEDININEFRVRKSQSHFNEAEAYSNFNAFQVDNRAMTITTFKQLK